MYSVMWGNPNLSQECMSAHISWDQLQDIARKQLSDLFGREIEATSDRQEYYYWGFNIAGTPLSKKEIEKLFVAVGADDFDHESNDFGEYPITEINQGLAEKMLAAELPFIMSKSHADDEGVWFFGPPENKMADILVNYPDTTLVSDCFRFSMKDGVSPDDIISCFYDAFKELAGDKDVDRLSRIYAVIDRVTDKTGCKVNCLSMSFEVEVL